MVGEHPVPLPGGRVLCEALRVDMPLEFFCVVRGTADHEAVLRTNPKVIFQFQEPYVQNGMIAS